MLGQRPAQAYSSHCNPTPSTLDWKAVMLLEEENKDQ